MGLARFKNLGLGTKFVLVVAAILTATMAVAATINYRSNNQLFEERLRGKGRTLGAFLASITPEAILSYDFVTLNSYARVVTLQEEIVYAVIVSPRGAPMTSFVDDQQPYMSAALEHHGDGEVRTLVDDVKGHSSVMPLSFPIDFNGERLGQVELGLDRRGVVALSRAELIKQVAGNLVVIVLLSLLIFVVFRRYALRPIQHLKAGADRVAARRLDQPVPVASNDELGMLARSFNQMMERLAESIAEKDRALAQLQELNRTLEARVAERTRDLETANHELEYRALHDTLTGLPNRTLVMDRIDQGLRVAQRGGWSLAVMMIDLDGFKEINDTLGHDVGDRLLQDVGQRLRATLREGDTVGRLGGDEFAVVLAQAEPEEALTVADKIAVALDPSFCLDGLNVSVTASIGIAVYPDHGAEAGELLKCADLAMFVAKQGRSGRFLYHATADYHSPGRLALVSRLREALEDDALVLYFQPIVELRYGEVVALEALVRWPHGEGVTMPDEFITQVEHTGVLRPLTLWTIDRALAQCHQWRSAGIQVKTSVNLSASVLNDPTLPDDIAALIDDWQAAGDWLVLEITESAAMDDGRSITPVLARMHEMGVTLAVDDFGSGYTSLGQLKRLPVSSIKIDRQFVAQMTDRADDAVIARSMIELAHNLGLDVVAEGVETAEVLERLVALGCDRAQGFYIGHPQTGEAITRSLGGRGWRVAVR